MKHKPLLLILSFSFFIHYNGSAQDTLNTQVYYQRLYHLGKVWGYTKYFHPKVASCSYAWDKALVESIDLVKATDSNDAFNDLLQELFVSLGEVPISTLPAPDIDEDLSYNLNLEWFDDANFTLETKDQLVRMRDNYRARNQCKLTEAFNGGNIVFESDNAYNKSNIEYPNEGERVLAIFRYWNIINYFFPYKYQMDQDWDETLKQFIPPIVSAKNALEYHLAFKELTTYINDSHAFFSSNTYGEWLGSNLAPFIVDFVENQTVITKVHSSLADEIKVGDVITSIDGKSINQRREEIRKLTAGSNEPTIQRNINYTIVRGIAGRFELSIKNAQGEKRLEPSRKTYQAYQTLYASSSNEAYKILAAPNGCEFGYLDLAELTSAQVPTVFEEYKDLPALIIDVRNYPNGTLWTMVDYLFDTPINFSAFTQPNIRYPGLLNFYQHSIGKGDDPYKGKLVLLFNELTQSQAEFTIMGLELHPDAIKVGSQTAGADGNISRLYLPGGIETVFTGLGVFYPDGRETQRIGIVPDFEVHPTIQGIREGRDEVLEFAMDCQLVNLVGPEFSEGNGLDVFPNPVEDKLNIKSQYTTTYTIQMTDILGRFIQGFKIDENTIEYDLNLSGINQGVYLLSFRDKDGIFAVEKIIKL